MKIVTLNNLPVGAQVRGFLYDDPNHVYGLGDVLEVELPTGRTIDVSWDEDLPSEPFRIVVYREYFGDHFIDFRVREIDDVVREVSRLALEHSQPYVATADSPAKILSAMPSAKPLVQLAACVGWAMTALPQNGFRVFS